MKHKKYLFLVLLLSAFSFYRLIRPGYFPMHDDMQATRVMQMDKCLRDGQFPCRWVPDLGFGYGYPLYIFYSPLAYYVMEVFHLIGFSFIASVKIVFILSFIFAGASMFVLGQALWGNLGGLVSAMFYVYAPYRASDVYSRGAVGEFWALIFLPLILWSILNLIKNEKQKKSIIYLSLSVTGLLLSHNLTIIAFTPIAALWTLVFLFLYYKKGIIKKIILAVALGVGLSAFYLIPMIAEKSYVHIDSMTSGYFNYLAHFVSLKQLFLNGHWGYGSSELGPYDDLSFQIGVIHWLIVLISLVLAFIKKKRNKIDRIIVVFLSIVFITAIALCHSKSTFIWQTITPMKYFQFPWRFLTMAILSSSIIAGFPLKIIKNKRRARQLTALLIFLLIFFYSRFFSPSQWLNIKDQDKFSGENWKNQQTMSIFDYLPIFASAPPASPAPQEPQIIHGQANIINFQKGTNWQKGEVDVSQPATIQLPLFFYPGFKLWLNQKETDFSYQNQLGLITFNLPSGRHQFLVKLTSTLDRKIGDTISLISILVLIYLFYAIKKEKK